MSGFPTLELGFPGGVACPDNYTSSSTLYCGGAGRLRIQSSLAFVVLQFGVGVGGAQWGPEEPIGPTLGVIARRFDAVRVRNYIAGKAAQILLTAYPA